MNETGSTILRLLRDAGAHVSGANMSVELGLSRTAVWKQVSRLRDLGYVIDSTPNKGYRLRSAPNVPLASEVLPRLQTQQVGQTFHFLDTTESTNLVASRMAADGAPHGTVIAADTQTHGRGRLARTWFSPRGVNLYMSVILRPRVEPACAPQAAIVTALAVVRALSKLHPPLQLGIKWPNDVYLAQRKLAGILCELSAESDHVHYLVIGLGMNVNLPREQLPAEIAGSATSLLDATGAESSRPAVLAAILNEMEPVYDTWCAHGLQPFLDEWQRYSVLQGRAVTVETLAGTIRGTVLDLSPGGALVLQTADGEVRQVLAGDVQERAI